MNLSQFIYRKLISLALVCFSTAASAQDIKLTEKLNANAIPIEDTHQETKLTAFGQGAREVFKDVRLFGFGEATHYTKEFFDVKAKFFKYLVENENVTVFMIEDSYDSGHRINTWLAGGEGDAESLARQTGFAIWRNKEVLDLLKWMKSYNEGVPPDKKVKFHGIDSQFGRSANTVVKEFIGKYSLTVPPNTNALLDSCANLNYAKKYGKKIKSYIDDINNLKITLERSFKATSTTPSAEFDYALHALDILIQFAFMVDDPSTERRDRNMADNILWALGYEGKNAKGFVWAHNAHIDLTEDSTPMGYHLKQALGNAYYSVGFDFGWGELYGQMREKAVIKGILHKINKPDEGTYAEVFAGAVSPVFFIDFKGASTDEEMKRFLTGSRRLITTGANGYNPKILGRKQNISELYDGLIFVREITHATYFIEAIPKKMHIVTR